MINSSISAKFKKYGLDEATILSCPVNAHDNTRLIYTCRCGAPSDRSWRVFMEKPLCNKCMPCKKTGQKCPDLGKFVNLIVSEGYKVVSTEGYTNCHSKIQIIDPLGNECVTTYNKWVHGNHRSKFMANENLKLSIEEVKRRVEGAGFKWLEDTVYKTEKTPFAVECHCGNLFEVCLGNIKENRAGCPSCFAYNRKYPWSYIEGVADKYEATLISDGSTYRGRDTIIEILCACGEHMVKNVRAFLKSPICNGCVGVKRNATNIERYGHPCYFGSDLGKDIIKQYWLNKCGVSHNMKVKEIQEKAQATCLKNYGVKCILSTEEVLKKALDAHILKWGAPPGCVEEIREKMKTTNMQKLGVEYPLESKEIQKKVKANNLEKYGHEMFIQSKAGRTLMKNKYDSEYYVTSDHYHNFMIETFGFPYPTQCPELLSKARKTAYSHKPYTLPSGKVIEIQGYESFAIDYILEVYNVTEEEIETELEKVPCVMYDFPGNVKPSRYFMDIYLSKKGVGFEVKSAWTYYCDKEKNKLKWIEASKICKNGFYVLVFDAKANLISEEFLKDGELQSFSVFPNTKPFKSIL